MSENRSVIRPGTLALDDLIKQSIEQAEQRDVHPTSNTILFLGNRHASFPVLVVQDPILEPVDKLVWMTIRLAAGDTGSNTAFPSFIQIAKTANVSSTKTISRAIAILRLTRWLTLCARIRGASGRFQGNIYALHDEPLPLVDAIHLDSDYMSFLHESAGHHHARVKTVARGVLETVDEDIEAGRNVCVDEHPIVRRAHAMEAVESDMPRRYFAFSANVLSELRSQMTQKKDSDYQEQKLPPVKNRVQNMDPQNLPPSSCSSYINKKTTTTTNTESKKKKILIYPKRLSENQCDLADRYLSSVPQDQRQALLDELEGRIRSEKRGMKPLYDELSFLHALCKALKNGTFKRNLGIKVHEQRLAGEKASQESSAPQASRSTDRSLDKLRKEIQAGKGPLAEIRKILGMPSPSSHGVLTSTS